MYTKKTHRVTVEYNQDFYLEHLLSDDEKVIRQDIIENVKIGKYFSQYNKVIFYDERGEEHRCPASHLLCHPSVRIKTNKGRIIETEIVPANIKHGIINYYEIKPFLFFFQKKEPIQSTFFTVTIKEVPIEKQTHKTTKDTKEDYEEFIKN